MASILRRGDSYSVRFKCRQCKEKHGFPAGVQKVCKSVQTGKLKPTGQINHRFFGRV